VGAGFSLDEAALARQLAHAASRSEGGRAAISKDLNRSMHLLVESSEAFLLGVPAVGLQLEAQDSGHVEFKIGTVAEWPLAIDPCGAPIPLFLEIASVSNSYEKRLPSAYRHLKAPISFPCSAVKSKLPSSLMPESIA
jgi:hypothetical protein